jgi:predicted nucleic acid-binding protein
MRFLLDTNILSELGKPRPHSKVVTWMLQHEANSAIPSIALAERYQGVMNLLPGKRREEMLRELRALVQEAPERILPFDALAAEIWGDYVTRPSVKNRPVPYSDSQIAAIAIAHNLAIVTRNTKDFPDVLTINPFAD